MVTLTRSPMEQRFWSAWQRRCPATPFDPQVRIIAAKGHPVVDFVHRGSKTVVEVDGVRWHGTPEDRAHDAERDQALAAAGYRVVRLSGRDVWGDVGACVERVAAAIGEPRG